MLVSERQKLILHRIQVQGFVRNIDLAEEFGVSDETIRKDLTVLEQMGRAVRNHGGAERPSPDRFDLPLPVRTAVNEREKDLIARVAADLISPRETIFLDASSTVLRLADHLPVMPLTVVTNAHHIVVSLATRPDLTLVCTGGTYENQSRGYTGAMAEDASKRFVIRSAFLGVDALDPDRGAMDVNHGHGVLKQRLIERVDRVIILADSSKLGARSAYRFADLSDIDILVTDDAAAPEILARFKAAGITVMVAKS
ncbi:DeoR/GlpR transcriptional regulator [Luteolibacter pohnpeiensis]|uniref:DeoR/GlpR transcriptional regulator n=1 Tax=Luteolibacter pohnpeiensis TaxID=454153 RepID=A0A934VUY6_9BACT|nr:DeoR/GlpR family DNA-binding transcription regulator [Luteolibacter pohnpeiensis]MBK1881630.1 DeoR/GlpR transcriptional regulator [Luteolibacter pohnpeiensis]